MAQFIITKMNHNPERFRAFIAQRDIHQLEKLYEQINKAIQGKRMDVRPTIQLKENIVGITLFPFIATTMVQSIFDFNEQQLLNF